jgi:hypothetical protein
LTRKDPSSSSTTTAQETAEGYPSHPAVSRGADDFLAGRVSLVQAPLTHKPIPLLDKALHFGLHALEQRFSRSRAYPGPLELEDFLSLAADLRAHVLDLGADVF